jgi:hypothetical protein
MATTPQPTRRPRRASAPAYQAIPAGTVFRAIACHNPHAVRIALGLKRIETRVWSTSFRAPLLICSTVRPRLYPNGYALCVAELVDCRPMVEADEPLAWVKFYDAFAWVLEDVRPITPFKVSGRQRFFDVAVPGGVGYLPRFATAHQGELFA